MKFIKLLLTISLVGTTGAICYSQTDNRSNNESILPYINRVENSLSPLVLNEEDPLWNIEKQMQKYNISGLSLAIINNYKIHWSKSYGSTGNEDIPEVTEHTVFQAASMSKFVNAIAILQLKASINLNLDEDINAYLKSWKFT